MNLQLHQKFNLILVLLSFYFIILVNGFTKRYEPNWDSLDSRPTPQWFDKAKIGIFLHWGVYSVPAVCTEWMWAYWKGNSSECVEYMNKNYPPGFTYQDFGPKFTAEFFDPEEWADLFHKAGAKYVIITTKHHDGFTLFPSKYTFGWNAKDVGPHRDIVGELASAVKNKNMHFGTYYSLYEWYNPLYLQDKESNFVQSFFVDNKMLPEMKQLVETYEPDVFWVDGDWEASDDYFKSKEFLAWLYNDSPVNSTILVNDRWGIGIPCKHGDYYSCADRFNPGVLQGHKWEGAMAIDKHSWAYRKKATIQDYLSTQEMIQTMVEIISCGGNFLLNFGPNKEGLLIPLFQERMTDLGNWLAINGEAIYESNPWTHQNDTNGITWYTAKENAVYALNLEWPRNNNLTLYLSTQLFIDNTAVVTLFGHYEELEYFVDNEKNSVTIIFPDKSTVYTNWVYVIKILNNK